MIPLITGRSAMRLRMWHSLLLVAAFSLAVLGGACAKSDKASLQQRNEGSPPMTIKLSSASFAEGQSIPPKFTCDGQDVSPSLSWEGATDAAKSFALICDDPDAPAGTWVHWVLYDLPASAKELPEAIEAKDEVLSGAKQGTNDFKRIGYGGPCPPKGAPHRYFFKLYALDRELGLKSGATKSDLEQAMKGHIVGEAKLMGTYKRM